MARFRSATAFFSQLRLFTRKLYHIEDLPKTKQRGLQTHPMGPQLPTCNLITRGLLTTVPPGTGDNSIAPKHVQKVFPLNPKQEQHKPVSSDATELLRAGKKLWKFNTHLSADSRRRWGLRSSGAPRNVLAKTGKSNEFFSE
jgi:hypothetical protein